MGVDAGAAGELGEVFAIGVNREHLKIGAQSADESDAIAPGRPDGEVVPLGGELREGAVVEIEDAQALFAIWAHGAIDDALAVWRKLGKGVGVGAGGDQVKAGAVS